jgi:hypothetical protein
MNCVATGPKRNGYGICVWEQDVRPKDSIERKYLDWLDRCGVIDWIELDITRTVSQVAVHLSLAKEKIEEWTPGGDTLELAVGLSLTNQDRSDLEKEILVAMLASPAVFEFPSLEELESHIRVRRNIVEAAAKTHLSFAAYEAERPPDFWEYDSNRGFVIRPGKCMIAALRNALHPPIGETVYCFSCYRATEYIVALGLAEEAHECNRDLFCRLQSQAEKRAIKSGEFHEVFMKEYGSRERPLSAKYYVPGDRVWFRNPDVVSSDAIGFEGSWVFYQGRGLFSDFWKRDQAFTLQSKSLEIYHWRNSTYQDSQGELKIDEQVVQSHVQSTLNNPSELGRILQSMERIQDSRGIYADGGCIDPTREYPRWVRPGTTDIVLPDV